MSNKIQVLQVFGCLDRGGAENMIMSVYRNIDREKFQFDFVVHLNREGDFDKEVKALGGKIYHAPKYNGKNHFEYKKWWKVFLKNHPEYKILHSHVRSTAAIYTKIAKQCGLKTIVHSHNTLSGKGISAKVKDLLQKNITKNADLCLACSDLAGEWLFKNHKYELYANTIDAKKFLFNPEVRSRCRQWLGVDEGTMVVGHVGRYHVQKNHKFLIDIYAKILEKNKNSALVMVGEKIGSEGIERSELSSYAKEKGVFNNCIFAGNVSNVNECLQAFDVFVFPSLHEGLPVTLIEAQAAGLPCVISNRVSNEAAITNLVEFLPLENEAELWASAAIKKSESKRKNMYEEIYNAGYDILAGVDKLARLYLNLLNS